MADTTPQSGIPYPLLVDPPNIEAAVKPLAEHIDNMVVSRFSTTSERDGAITDPIEGQVCYVASHGLQLYGNGPGWVPVPGTEVLTVRRNTAQSISNNTETAISFNDNTYVPWGGHSTSENPTRVTLPFAGRWMIYYGGGYASTGGADTTIAAFLKRDGVEVAGSHIQVLADGNLSIRSSCAVTMNGSDNYLELFVLQTSGSSLNTSTTAKSYMNLTAVYSGPLYV